jgi:ribosomal protein S27E
MNKNLIETKPIITNGKETDYLVIKELPSKFRLYKNENIDELYVRGLYFGEAINFAKYDNNNLSQLVNLYRNIIQPIDVKKLEMADFVVLTFFSTLGTVDNLEMQRKVQCPYCDNIQTITLKPEDLEFEEAQYYGDLPIEYEDFKIKPLLVEDFINIFEAELENFRDKELIENLKQLSKFELETIFGYASLIQTDEKYKTFEDKVKRIYYSNMKTIETLREIDNELVINIKPLEVKCKKCEEIFKVAVNLENIKARP